MRMKLGRPVWLLAKRALAMIPVIGLAGAVSMSAAEQMVPALGPLPAPPKFDAKKAEIGKLLFYEKRMAQDANRACFECHNAKEGYTTRLDLSDGYPATKHYRNAPTLLNSAYLDDLFWHGSQGDLETAVQWHMAAAFFMNADSRYIAERLHQIPQYNDMFKVVYPDKLYITPDINNAVAEYVRSLVSDPKQIPFDRAMTGGAALSPEAQRGMDLFKGKANCIQCHNGPLLTDEKFYNTAVPHNPVLDSDPERQIAMRYEYFIIGVTEYVNNPTRDWGQYIISHQPEDKGKFRTAPLRELKYTAPYMHNGVLKTLEQVVEFYNVGGGNDPLIAPTKSQMMRPLGLSPSEKKDLVAFLLSLSSDAQPHAEVPTKVGEEHILYGVFPRETWHYSPDNLKAMPKSVKDTR